MASSPDGTVLVSGSTDQTVRTWNPLTGKQITVLEEHEGDVTSLAFSPDGARLASSSADASARIWDAFTGEQLLVLRGHEGPVTSVVFSSDGALLVSASDDRTVRIWDTVPYRFRYRERQAILAARPEANRIVDEFWQKYSDWKTVAQRVREDAGLAEPLRRAALHEVLRRATGHP